jgi:K+-sensing histidine kinase KdpD
VSVTDREETRRTLRLIIRIRFIIVPAVLVLVAAAAFVGFARRAAFTTGSLPLHAVNAAVVIGLNALCLLLVGRVRDLRPLVLFQLAIDALNFTFTVYKTGGVASPLAFLYHGVIFAAALLLGARGTFLVAGVCAALYLGIVGLELLHMIPHQSYFVPLAGLHLIPAYVALSVLFTLFSLALIAFLASYLSAELRRRNRSYRQANARLSKKIAILQLLQRATEALNSSRRVKDVADAILGELLEFLRLDRALLYLNRDGRTLRLFMVKYRSGSAAAGRRSPRISIPLREGAGLTARVAIRRTAMNVRRPQDSRFINRELQKKIGTNPFAIAPLVVRDRLIGVLGVDRSLVSGEISDEEFQVLKIFAGQAAIAISGLRR